VAAALTAGMVDDTNDARGVSLPDDQLLGTLRAERILTRARHHIAHVNVGQVPLAPGK